jgi:DNA-binding GntR family transcriptional regulator
MATSQSWLSPDVLKGKNPPTKAELNAGSLYAWLERKCGVRIVGGEEFVHAPNSDEKTAQSLFKGRHFDRTIVVLCQRWYLRYKLSFRDV